MKKNEYGGDNPRSFAALAALFQVTMLVFFAVTCDYKNANTDAEDTEALVRVASIYPMFQDVHVMIFIGFGFLMTFLQKYGFSSVSYNFFISAIVIQWSIIMHGIVAWIIEGYHDINLHVETLVKGDFAAGAVLISFGAVLGRVTPTQLLVMAIIEIVFYAFNEHVGAIEFQAVDMGGSIFVHAFGAYFGLAVSKGLGSSNIKKHAEVDLNSSSYNSDMFAMIGTLFLWMFWPSFNGALAPLEGFQKERVVMNTVLALCASCVMAFAASRFFTHEQKFDMVHIQNATLAGGVAVGSSSDLVIGPWGALLIGSIAGVLSVVGYVYISPWLEKTFDLNDTCGVHNLHGLPGVMGGIGGAISAATATDKSYGESITAIFSGREDRTASEQGGFQGAALTLTLGIAMIGGYLTGRLLRSSLFNQEENAFDDRSHWELPEEAQPLRSLIPSTDNVELGHQPVHHNEEEQPIQAN